MRHVLRLATNATVSLVVAATLASCGGPDAPDARGSQESALVAKTALLVVGDATLGAGDAAMKTRLAGRGLTVVVRKDSALVAADVAGKSLVVVSSTVTSSAVAVNLRATAIPVLVWESALLDDYGMVANGALGAQSNQTKVALVAPAGDPMTAGLTGTQTVTTTTQAFSWGKPAAAATVVARLSGDATKAVIFRYEKGAAMIGLSAPERRAALFLGDTTASVLTTQGRALVDAAIDWAAHNAGKPNGAACAAAADCASSFCVDGVCCTSACTGACLTCAGAGSAGTCSAAAAGQTDPHGQCSMQAASTCGRDGTCNGAGACRLYGAGVVCAAPTCANPATSKQPSTCDGAGTCRPGPQQSCAPFSCAAGACRTTCAVDADCVAPNRCQGGRCASPLTNGAPCARPTDCASGACVDGVCCATSSCGPCTSCAMPGAQGTCRPVASGAPDPRGVCVDQGPASCGMDGRCDGTGACQRYAAGTACAAGSCPAGSPTLHQPSTCDGTGTCLAGPLVSCAPFLCDGAAACGVTCVSDAQCVAGFRCTGGLCASRLGNGQSCAAANDCLSGACVDGVCCGSVTCGSCQSCAVPGSMGTCAIVPAGAIDPRGVCADQGATSCGTNGRCDGTGACQLYPASTTCSAASCPAGTGTMHFAGACSGTGACASSTVSCAPYLCASNGTACGTTCVVDVDCSPGFHCTGGICGP